jgi:hypothetical protein
VINLFPQILFGIIYFMDFLGLFHVENKITFFRDRIGADHEAKNKVNTYSV